LQFDVIGQIDRQNHTLPEHLSFNPLLLPTNASMTFNLFGRQREVGEILKAERMLVRIELIDDVNAKIPKEYTENTRIETRLKRAWREYYVVARAGANESKHIILHIHKNRVLSHGSKGLTC